jgi:hypothetical protein
MHFVLAIVSVFALIALSIIQARSRGDKIGRDFIMMGSIAMLIVLYNAF